MNINWENSQWKDRDNLINYIRKYGNGNIQLNKLTQPELLKLAKSTEKALALIEEESIPCSQCNCFIDTCKCRRCDSCYNISTLCTCQPAENQSILRKKIIFAKNDHQEADSKNNDDDDAEKELLLQQLQINRLKLMLKLFIQTEINELNCKTLNADVLKICALAIKIHHRSFTLGGNNDDDDKQQRNLVSMFQILNDLPRKRQILILETILDSLNITKKT